MAGVIPVKSTISYFVHLLHFPSLTLMKYIKWNTKIRDVCKNVSTGMFSNRKKWEQLKCSHKGVDKNKL